MYPLVKELAANGIPVAVTCRVLKLARQPYYRWLADPVTTAEHVAAQGANAAALALVEQGFPLPTPPGSSVPLTCYWSRTIQAHNVHSWP